MFQLSLQQTGEIILHFTEVEMPIILRAISRLQRALVPFPIIPDPLWYDFSAGKNGP